MKLAHLKVKSLFDAAQIINFQREKKRKARFIGVKENEKKPNQIETKISTKGEKKKKSLLTSPHGRLNFIVCLKIMNFKIDFLFLASD